MTRKMNFTRWMLLLSGLFIVAWGVSMLFSPLANLLTLSMLIGIAILFLGITEITTYFSEDTDQRSGLTLISGVVAVLFGFRISFGLGAVTLAAMLPLLFGLLILVYGVMRVIRSFAIKREGFDPWIMSLSLGILKIALGCLLMFYPVLSTLIISTTLAVILIAHGINNILRFFGSQKLNNHLTEQRAKVVDHVLRRGVAYYEV